MHPAPRPPRAYLVTGAGRGLGLALAEAIVARGDVVVGTIRDLGRARGLVDLAERARGRVHLVTLDVSDAAACATLGRRVSSALGADARVDGVINNAGINSSSADVPDPATARSLESLSGATMEAMFRTNALGALWVTRALLPYLGEGARVVNVSSRRGALHEKSTGGNYGYCMTKAALNMATRALAADLAPRGVVVVAVHPGNIRTAMAQADAQLSPEEAAASLLALVDRLGVEDNGRFLDTSGKERAW